jgi:flagellar hook assembly protein FlgD
VELPSGAAGGSVRILDGAGNTVRTLEVPAGAGRQALPWDGKDAGGNRLQDGTYTIEVTGTDPDGGSVRGTSFLQGQVERVRFSDGLVYLEVAGQSLPLDLVVEIANAAPGGASSRVPAARAFSAF